MIPGSANPLLLASTAGYKISRSVRLNSVDSAYFSRTPASAGNRKTWTWSGWVKRSGLGTYQSLFNGINSQSYAFLHFISDNTLAFEEYGRSNFVSSAVFRDTSAWMHITLTYDTTNATAADRIKIFVNGVRLTSAYYTAPTVNTDGYLNQATAHDIGRFSYAYPTYAYHPNAYLADIYFIDGQALTPSSFGQFDTNNVWQPKAYTGTYGTNGFQLKFADNSNNTATTLGKDTSGNSNNWTPNNLSVTAGAGNDSLTDSPTNYGTDTGAGGEVRGNYCTLNPLANGGNALSDGNLRVVGASDKTTLSTIGMSSGKWYCEATVTAVGTSFNVGIARGNAEIAGTGDWLGNDANGWSYGNNGQKFTNNSGSAYGSSFTTGDLIGIAFDADNGTLTFYKNNVSQGTAFSGLTSGPYFFGIGSASPTADFNFGQRPFAYTAPSGFKALCTANLPTPTITKPSTVMDVVTYTGTGSTLTPTSTLGFSPDLVWIKSRSAATDHALYDAVRGAQARLESNTTDAEATSDNGLTAFNSNGFTLGTLAQVNSNAATYAGWCWDAGSSTVTNTAGSISSQVRANASAGFSIVTWTGNGATNATVGHGLNIAPLLYIVKRRDSTSNWAVFLTTLIAPSGGNPQRFLNLNNTDAASNASQALPSSTVLTVQSVFDNINSATYVAYCFAPVAGYSAFGSYTGNGSTDGPYIHLGFRPAFVIIKCSSASGTSFMSKDYKRAADYNPASGNLYLDATNTEDTINTVDMDFLANGIKLRGTYSGINSSSNTYIYAAWAQYPFALARAR